MKKNILSKICILIFAFYWVFSFFHYKRIDKNPIQWDVVSYYGYLPAVFIYHDITLHFIDKNPAFFSYKYWPEKAPNGGRVIKTSMGVSYLYAPFFFLGHWYAGMTGEPQDGYSLPYHVFLQIGTLFYALLGFIFLRNLLLRYFSDRITSLTILSVFFGTNLLYYATGAALMSHAYLFSVSCIYLFATDNWHRSPTIKTSILMGLTGGLLTLIKPTMIVCVLIPLLWNITNIKSLKEKVQFIANNKWKLVLIIIFFILPGVPQLIYWKYITGDWLYYSYTGEKFFFDNPHILWGWFSYRNGWLLYTPIMVFSLTGFFFMRAKIKHMTLPFLLVFALTAYIVHSWWCWWHGGYGLRAYVELYGVLAFPMAAFYDFLLRKKIIIRISILSLTVLLIAHNIFQTWQFEKDILHFAGMTKKSYWLGFLKTEIPGVWWQCLKDADIENAKKGLPEYPHEKKPMHHDIIKINSFEDAPKNKNSIFYSSEISKNGKYSFILKDTNVYSPSIEMRGGELLNDTSKGKRQASVEFYFKEHDIEPEEARLVFSFENDSGIYFYKGIDFYVFDFESDKWNTAKIEMPVKEIKSANDKIEIYVWGPNVRRDIFIDDLKYEIIR